MSEHVGCTCPICTPELWAAGIKGSGQAAAVFKDYPNVEFELAKLRTENAALKKRLEGMEARATLATGGLRMMCGFETHAPIELRQGAINKGREILREIDRLSIKEGQ